PDAVQRTQLQLTLSNPGLCERLTRYWQSSTPANAVADDSVAAPPLQSSVDVTPLPACGPQPAGNTK
ncbi:MAG: hypothetical protein ACRC60_09875, partial [Plesiomonas shigelloides]